MELDLRNRIAIGTIVFAIITNVHVITTALSTPFNFNKYINNPINSFQHRYDSIKELLPRDEVVGYVSDDKSTPGISDTKLQAEFFMTQYALAPQKITNSLDPKYIIGNFHTNPIPQITKNNLTIIKAYGNGVILLKKGN